MANCAGIEVLTVRTACCPKCDQSPEPDQQPQSNERADYRDFQKCEHILDSRHTLNAEDVQYCEQQDQRRCRDLGSSNLKVQSPEPKIAGEFPCLRAGMK